MLHIVQSAVMANLSKYLSETGTSQSDFAALIGVDKGTVSRIVSGKLTPRLYLAARIEEATGGAVKAVSLVGKSVHHPPHGASPAAVQGGGAQ